MKIVTCVEIFQEDDVYVALELPEKTIITGKVRDISCVSDPPRCRERTRIRK